jgi:isoleucyl-tRNA synthetase
MARELISKVQQMRKNNNYDVIDRIIIYHDGNDELTRAIEKHSDFIKMETLAEQIIINNSIEETINLNGIDVKLEISRVR